MVRAADSIFENLSGKAGIMNLSMAIEAKQQAFPGFTQKRLPGFV
jgi:hypothetical protein